MPRLTALLMALAVLIVGDAADAEDGRRPSEYGGVTISAYSGRAGLAPVRFDHWLHRALYTCRLCHVDIGFSMEGNATGITADTNMRGYHCGSCHDGKRPHDGEEIFASCSLNATPGESVRCGRCHSVGRNVKKEYDYAAFTGKFPKSGPGNLIAWEEAEARGIIRPVDHLPGVSMRRPPLNPQKDFVISSKSSWMPDIIFSHRKHVAWNGCEVCHPDIFPSARKGTVKYSMLEISQGRYCGLCHDRVAFPLNDCETCHAKPVP